MLSHVVKQRGGAMGLFGVVLFFVVIVMNEEHMQNEFIKSLSEKKE